MTEPALRLVPQEDEVTREVVTVENQAKELKVIDAASYIAAGELWKSIKALRAKVADTFDDIIKAAHLAHKKAVEKKKMHDGPLDAAERIVKQALSAYDLEQERIRLAEQRRLEEIARKQTEEEALLAAIAAEEEAKRNGATKEEAAQEVAAILEEAVYVAPIVIPKAVPKMAGGPVYQTRWDFEIVNEALIPRQYLTVDMVKIRQVVTALKDQANIPGIKAYSKRV
jgi:hypothetical protein